VREASRVPKIAKVDQRLVDQPPRQRASGFLLGLAFGFAAHDCTSSALLVERFPSARF
jgi:hypothetical protein